MRDELEIPAGAASTSDLTRPGCRSASRSATSAPIEWPKTRDRFVEQPRQSIREPGHGRGGQPIGEPVPREVGDDEPAPGKKRGQLRVVPGSAAEPVHEQDRRALAAPEHPQPDAADTHETSRSKPRRRSFASVTRIDYPAVTMSCSADRTGRVTKLPVLLAEEAGDSRPPSALRAAGFFVPA